jgi:hypothetical protein
VLRHGGKTVSVAKRTRDVDELTEHVREASP